MGGTGPDKREASVMQAPRVTTITRNSDFKRIYARGKSRVHALLVTYALKNRTGEARIAFVSSKKIGGAVQRNRARRVVRAALRMSGAAPVPGWDVVFVCRTRTAAAKSTAVAPVLRRHMAELVPGAADGAGSVSAP